MDLREMTRQPGRAVARAIVVTAGALAFATTLLAVPASADPSPTPSPQPERTIELSSDLTATPIVVSSIDDSRLYQRLVSEVDWLGTGPGVTKSPDGDALGAKITMVLAVDGKVKQTFDLYPLADGGPRAYRPATKSGKHKVSAAWFYGRLCMASTLAATGIPILSDNGCALGTGGQGGQGGGTQETASAHSAQTVVSSWGQLIKLNSLLVLAIGLVVFVLAFLFRRRA